MARAQLSCGRLAIPAGGVLLSVRVETLGYFPYPPHPTHTHETFISFKIKKMTPPPYCKK